MLGISFTNTQPFRAGLCLADGPPGLDELLVRRKKMAATQEPGCRIHVIDCRGDPKADERLVDARRWLQHRSRGAESDVIDCRTETQKLRKSYRPGITEKAMTKKIKDGTEELDPRERYHTSWSRSQRKQS